MAEPRKSRETILDEMLKYSRQTRDYPTRGEIDVWDVELGELSDKALRGFVVDTLSDGKYKGPMDRKSLIREAQRLDPRRFGYPPDMSKSEKFNTARREMDDEVTDYHPLRRTRMPGEKFR